MVKSHAKTAVFSLTAKSPNIHAKSNKGRSISESTTSFLQCVGMVYYCSIVCAPLQLNHNNFIIMTLVEPTLNVTYFATMTLD